MSDKKSLIYYSCISVSEGLNTGSTTQELCLEKYDKEIYKKCKHCHLIAEIKKQNKKDINTWDMCFKLLGNDDKINPMIQICGHITKCRVFTNLHCSYTNGIFRRVWIKEKSGKISNETIYFYLNSFI